MLASCSSMHVESDLRSQGNRSRFDTIHIGRKPL
jgi:hypothetical protein